jgi:hypothetical protein
LKINHKVLDILIPQKFPICLQRPTLGIGTESDNLKYTILLGFPYYEGT